MPMSSLLIMQMQTSLWYEWIDAAYTLYRHRDESLFLVHVSISSAKFHPGSQQPLRCCQVSKHGTAKETGL